MKIAVLQMPTLSMSGSRIDYYLKIAADNGAKIALLGEYVCNSFFTELIKMPPSMIKEQSKHKISLFTDLSKKYNLNIIAPIVQVKSKKIYKMIAKFGPKSVKFWEQNFLINYSHWDEEKFFANHCKKENEENLKKIKNIELPTFWLDGVKFGVICGFEAHFDATWQYFMKKNVDCILMPTASTFDSNERWNELLKIRAWTNLLFIIRANRIGKAEFDDKNYEFYGESMLISPFGEILNSLKKNEGIMIAEISKTELKNAQKLWKFREILNKKGLI